MKKYIRIFLALLLQCVTCFSGAAIKPTLAILCSDNFKQSKAYLDGCVVSEIKASTDGKTCMVRSNCPNDKALAGFSKYTFKVEKLSQLENNNGVLVLALKAKGRSQLRLKK